MKRRKASVVGGGIAGIVSALLLQEKGFEVDLLEQQPKLGGLLNSLETEWGCTYDFGTHFVAQTGIPALDELLLARIASDKWIDIPYLKAGTNFAGRTNTNSSCVDLRGLPEAQYEAVVRELLRETPNREWSGSLEEQLKAEYGSHACENVFQPILSKFFASSLSTLAKDAHLLFGLRRFIVLSESESTDLKKNPWIDERLAFHRYTEGVNALKSYYPREGGVGTWIAGLEEMLVERGIHIHKGRRIQSVQHRQGRATSVVLDGGASCDADLLIWTVAPDFLLRCVEGESVPRAPLPHTSMTLFHLLIDQAPLVDVYYLTCYNPAFSTFRITLYTNIQGRRRLSEGWHLTVEVLMPPGSESHSDPGNILEELKAMGVVSSSTRVLQSKRMQFGNAFPVLSREFVERRDELVKRVQAQFTNVVLAGKGAGSAFFTTDVLKNVYGLIESADDLQPAEAT